MSLFNWFSGKSAQAHSNGAGSTGGHARPPTPAVPATRPVSEPVERSSDDRKVKRHARREQLYAAVRDTMTQSGVLSSSYKFKVLSLDQMGNQFLVMMDIDQAVNDENGNLAQIEGKIIQSAKLRFEILVSSVYWRVAAVGLAPRHKLANPELPQPAQTPLTAAKPAPVPVPHQSMASRYEPIQNEEVQAFKQALASASAGGSSTSRRSTPRSKSAAPSYTLLTGFEDTEMPESYAAPVLSNTQYGDLR